MNYLKRKLKEKHISQSELARRLGTSKQYISALCLDKINIRNIRGEKLVNISIILDIPLDEFVKGIRQWKDLYFI